MTPDESASDSSGTDGGRLSNGSRVQTQFLSAPIFPIAGFRDAETGTVSVVFETDSPEQYTEFIRDVAPQLTTLLGDQPTAVQARVW